ncbi:lantibiotic dehydratase [Streptomyces sp. NPDC085524]|uniref:lantibiotic dehydratase n=1 Tax=Streptomyces sp. NPDC085524 TaxID=3365728 RepID=UPI0037D1B44F
MTGPGTGAPQWVLRPNFLLRRAGFPFELLDGPAAASTLADAVERYVDAVARLEQQRRALLRHDLPAAVERARADGAAARLRKLSRVRSALGRRRYDTALTGIAELAGPAGDTQQLAPALTRLGGAVREATEAAAAVTSALGRGTEEEHDHLVERIGLERVREALIQLSPSFTEQAERSTRRPRPPHGTAAGATRARDRKFLRTALLYLQRLAAKNESTSFFGPLTHGRFTADHEGYRSGPETPSGVRRREAFLTFWATAELARVIARDPELAGVLPVRRSPLVTVLDDGIRDRQGRVRRLGPLDLALLAAADATTGADALAASLASSTGTPAADVRSRIDRLTKAGLLLADLEPASTRPRPLDDLRALVRSLVPSSPWADRLDRVAASLALFGQASTAAGRADALRALEAEFHHVTGAPARRDGGRMYADRLVAYEECEGDAPPSIGLDVADRWSAALAPYLDLCAAYGVLRHEATRAAAERVLAEAGGELSYLDFAERLGALTASGAPERSLAEQKFTAGFAALVEAAGDGREAVLTPADLRPLTDLAAAAEAARSTPTRFVSPDLMVARDPGAADPGAADPGAADAGELLVLGELHPYVFAWGSQGLFAPDPESLRADTEAYLSAWGGPDRIATVLRRRRHKGLVSDAFPGRFIEVNGLATRDRSRCLAVADLRVAQGPHGPELLGPDGSLVLYTGENDHPHLRVFAPPQVEVPQVRIGDRRQRIRIGNVVVQRARWWLSADDLAALHRAQDSGRALMAAGELRAALDIPRYVFAKPEGEPKPICLDLSSPLAVSVLRQFADRPVVVEEMLPEPGRLWLRRGDGAYTSEFRLAMFRQVQS